LLNTIPRHNAIFCSKKAHETKTHKINLEKKEKRKKAAKKSKPLK
jgi:hypothetical protein